MSSSKPKILYIDPADFVGGAELFSKDVIPLLSQKFEIGILTNSKTSEYAKLFPKYQKISEFFFPRLKPFTPKNIFLFWKTAKKLRKYIEDISPHIVHTNSIRAHIIAAEAIRKIDSELRPKLTFFVHDFTFPQIMVRRFSKYADHIFTCSETVQEDLLQKGVNPKNISVVPNGIDESQFVNISKKSFTQDSPSFGILGRIDIWKGQDIFLEAAKHVLKTYPKATFHIYGKSSPHDKKTEDFEQQLHTYVAENNLSKNVIFHGFASLTEVFANTDVLVHASTQKEPFGRVIIESLAAGIPLIASNLGGPSEIITNGVEGILIDPQSPELLAEKMTHLITSESHRKAFSENGKKLVQMRYTLPKITKLLAERWEKIL